MFYAGVGNLHFIDGIMNHKMVYPNPKIKFSCQYSIYGTIYCFYFLTGFYFLSDCVFSHTVLNTRLWLLYNISEVLKLSTVNEYKSNKELEKSKAEL